MKNLAIAILALSTVLLAIQRHRDSERIQQQDHAISALRSEAAAAQKAQQLARAKREQTRMAYEQAQSIASRYRSTLAANNSKK